MENQRRTSLFLVLPIIMISPISLKADPVIISVTAPPNLSTLITTDATVSTSWSESKSYTDVSISALVDSALVGQTPTADAYLTSQIGPGTTAADEIAHAQFMVPAELPVCSYGCGAIVTLFSGLSLGPGNYFVTIGPDPTSVGEAVGWFPALDPTVLLDSGVSEGNSFLASAVASYPPASAFEVYTIGVFPPPGVVDVAMNLTVTGIAEVPIPEPTTATLIGLSTLFLLFIRRVPKIKRLESAGYRRSR